MAKTKTEELAAYIDGAPLDISNLSSDAQAQIEAARPAQTPAEQVAEIAAAPTAAAAAPAAAASSTAAKAKITAAKAADLVVGAGDKLYSGVTGTQEAIARAPTPGGIAVLVIVLIVLVWCIIPITSHDGTRTTRAGLFWYALTGRAYIYGRKDIKQDFAAAAQPTTPAPTTNAGMQATDLIDYDIDPLSTADLMIDEWAI